MTWLSPFKIMDLRKKGAKIGNHVKIDYTALITNPETLEIGDYSQIDAFTFISGKVKIGKFTEIGVHVTISGSNSVTIGDCCAISPYGYLFTNSADFHNESLSLPTVPKKFKRKTHRNPIQIDNHVIIGAHSVVFPGVHVMIGSKFGANCILKGYYRSFGLHVSKGNLIAERIQDLPYQIINEDYKKLLESISSSK